MKRSLLAILCAVVLAFSASSAWADDLDPGAGGSGGEGGGGGGGCGCVLTP